MQDIVIHNLCKAYGGRPVLKDFSCRFSAGEAHCLMAPSGHGKTTLLRILMGLECADSGSITGLDGLRICPVFQEDRLCENLSAEVNLRLASRALSRNDALKALSDSGLADFADQPVREFSGGMKRRVALLRALCAPGDVLILDEPFKGLDAEARLRMIRCTLNRRESRTLILVSHDAADARDMQARLIRMDELNHI